MSTGHPENKSDGFPTVGTLAPHAGASVLRVEQRAPSVFFETAHLSLTRREFLRLSAALTGVAFLSACQPQTTPTLVPTILPSLSPVPLTLAPTAVPTAAPSPTPITLRVLGENHPRAFYFRAAETWANNSRISYEDWDRTFSRLMGIEGKVYDEEFAATGPTGRRLEFFTRFKKQHPEQQVILHFNGSARDPRFDASKFFAGHWLYFNGAKITGNVPAEPGETEIRVSDASLFRINIGFFNISNEDIGLCELDANGKPNWLVSEQVQLVSVNTQANTIRVKRGAYGTSPRAFAADRAYAAAHVTQGPWDARWNLIWYYNFTATCPRDANGKSCTDIFVDDLAQKFAPTGELAAFDGIQFDVLDHSIHSLSGRQRAGQRAPDADADGKADDAIFGGVNTYSNGVVEFCRSLRERMSPKQFVMSDGWASFNVRAFGILNGIESEGWPSLNDYQVRDWSGGLNRQAFWVANSRAPGYSYIIHKFHLPGGGVNVSEPDATKYPWGIHRLVFAGALFADSAITYIITPPNESGELFAIWDELWMGTEKKLGWLGKPLGAAVHLAEREKNLLDGVDVLTRLQGDGIEFTRDGSAIKIAAKNPGDARFRLVGMPTSAPDLLFTFTLRADPLPGYAPEIARLIQFGASPRPNELPNAWVNQKAFTYRHYASDWQASELTFLTEGNAPIWISGIGVFAFQDAMYREFENGLVLANPSTRPFTFDLRALFPNKAWRRIQATLKQDLATNNGARVDTPLTLAPKDAIFLARA